MVVTVNSGQDLAFLIEKSFSKIADHITDSMADDMQQIANMLAVEAKVQVPVWSGALRSTIRGLVSTINQGKRKKVRALVTAGGGGAITTNAVDSDPRAGGVGNPSNAPDGTVRYAASVHETKKPFLLIAFQNKLPQIRQIVRGRMEKAVVKAKEVR